MENPQGWQAIAAQLQAPFRPEEIYFAVEGALRERGGIQCFPVRAHVFAHAIQDRLDAVLGSQHWSFTLGTVTGFEGRIYSAPGSLSLGGYAPKAGIGYAGRVGPNETVTDDTLRACARMWGIGRYLERVETQWVPVQAVNLQAKTILPSEIKKLQACLPRPQPASRTPLEETPVSVPLSDNDQEGSRESGSQTVPQTSNVSAPSRLGNEDADRQPAESESDPALAATYAAILGLGQRLDVTVPLQENLTKDQADEILLNLRRQQVAAQRSRVKATPVHPPVQPPSQSVRAPAVSPAQEVSPPPGSPAGVTVAEGVSASGVSSAKLAAARRLCLELGESDTGLERMTPDGIEALFKRLGARQLAQSKAPQKNTIQASSISGHAPSPVPVRPVQTAALQPMQPVPAAQAPAQSGAEIPPEATSGPGYEALWMEYWGLHVDVHEHEPQEALKGKMNAQALQGQIHVLKKKREQKEADKKIREQQATPPVHAVR